MFHGTYLSSPLTHDIYLTLSNEASLDRTINQQSLTGGVAYAKFSGEIVGPAGYSFPGGNNTVALWVNNPAMTGSPAASTTNIAFSYHDNATNRDHVTFSVQVPLAAGEETSSLYIKVTNNNNETISPTEDVLPQIIVDTIAPSIATVAKAPSGTNPVSSVSFTLNEATTSTIGVGSLKLTRNGTNVDLAHSAIAPPVVTRNNSTSYTISGLSGFTTTPGIYVLTVSGAGLKDAAGNVGTGSASTSFTIQAPPPPPPPLVTVASVQLVQNKKHMVTQITVNFSGAVNMTEADIVGTYRLATAGKKNSFDAKNAKVLKLRSAVYNPATNAVVLTPQKAFALTKAVQLRVFGTPPGGLQDSVGRLIDGDHNGQAGGNAQALLGKGGVTLSFVKARGN